MGWDIDFFMDPVSKHLICPICQDVLRNPVSTPEEHLFCEACLLEWLTEHDTDPMTNLNLSPADVRPISRVVSNMLAELRVKCTNEGCSWSGELERLAAHRKACEHCSREALVERLATARSENEQLRKRIAELEHECKEQQGTVWLQAKQIVAITEQLGVCQAKLASVDATGSFSASDDEGGTADDDGEGSSTGSCVNAIKYCNLEEKTVSL